MSKSSRASLLALGKRRRTISIAAWASGAKAGISNRAPSEPRSFVITEVDDLEPAAKAFAAAQQPFHRWFKEQVLRISAVDPNIDPLGPPSSQVFSWPPTPGQAER